MPHDAHYIKSIDTNDQVFDSLVIGKFCFSERVLLFNHVLELHIIINLYYLMCHVEVTSCWA